jgi:hypothetical protein
MEKMRGHLIGDKHFFSNSKADQEVALCKCAQLPDLGLSLLHAVLWIAALAQHLRKELHRIVAHRRQSFYA